ncbi:MAG: CheB methylesterase domain-containing protein, partial [Planctomycetota bacterium]
MPCKKLVIVGVSTGGPRALRQLFTGMPRLEAGIILVQHMPKFINDSFQRTLDALTEMDVVIAQDGSRIDAGTVYLAPSDVHLELINNQRIRLADGPKVCFVKPSIDVTMLSARHRDDQELAAVVLTGMGRDGAGGLLAIRNAGGRCIAQDEESSVVFGMPKEAWENGAAERLVPLDKASDTILELLREPAVE